MHSATETSHGNDSIARHRDRDLWLTRVNSLVNQVETWAQQLGWSTRRVEKTLEDSWIGQHQVPALLLQEGTVRLILEPVGRSTIGAEGIVDLYLLPAYDDIASLYYYGDQWNLHYQFPGAKSVASVREADALKLSKDAFEQVVTQLRQHAA